MRSLFVLLALSQLWGTHALPSLLPRDSAPSYISLPFSKKLKADNAPKGRRSFTSALTPGDGLYIIDVEIGTPPQPLSLVLDTGSSDIWAYAPQAASTCPTCTTTYFDPSKSSSDVLRDDLGVFNISYGSANSGVTGYYVNDILSTNGVAASITLGIATEAHSGDPHGGIMGIGPSLDEASVGTSGIKYPGYISSLVNQGIIAVPAFSVYLDPNTLTGPGTGTIIFGGYDPSKYIGNLVPFPFVSPTPPPDSTYRLAIDEPTIQFSVNGDTYTVPPDPFYGTIDLDTGTSISRLDVAQVEAIASILGATPIPNDPVGAYAVSCDYADPTKNTGSWTFTFSGHSGALTITVPWSEMVLPYDSDVCVLGVVPEPNGEGNYAFGDNFLRSTYLIYNYPGGSVSMAQANTDDSCANCVQPLTKD